MRTVVHEFLERNQYLFSIRRLSKFSVQILRDSVCLLFVKTVVVIIKSTEVPLNTSQMWSDCVPGGGEGGGVLSYIGYIGVCGAKGHDFLAVSV